jgi:arylsulfatase A-like enzyme
LATKPRIGNVNCALSQRTPEVGPWADLTETQRSVEQVRMTIHAAMVDRVDQEIGRLLDLLKAQGQFDNPVIFFLSDNGASAESLVRGDKHDPAAPPGSAKTYLCLEPGWANVANAPLRRSKIFVHEGGITTPLVVHWPRGISQRGQLRHNLGHVIDLAPTILEIVDGRWFES